MAPLPDRLSTAALLLAPLLALGACASGPTEDETAKMLGGNAAEFYGVDTEKLAPLVARIGPEKRSFRTLKNQEAS